jgi:hypothetical protein
MVNAVQKQSCGIAALSAHRKYNIDMTDNFISFTKSVISHQRKYNGLVCSMRSTTTFGRP